MKNSLEAAQEVEDSVDDGDGSESPSKYSGDLFIGIALILLCVWITWQAIEMPRRGGLGLLTSPGLTPLLVAIVVGVLATMLIAKSLRGGAIAETPSRLSQMRRSPQVRRVLILAAIMIVYVGLIGILDFRLVTGLYLLATFIYVRVGGWILITLTTVGVTALVTVIIPDLFSMPIP